MRFAADREFFGVYALDSLLRVSQPTIHGGRMARLHEDIESVRLGLGRAEVGVINSFRAVGGNECAKCTMQQRVSLLEAGEPLNLRHQLWANGFFIVMNPA